MKETVLDCNFIILNRLPELYSARRFQAEINRLKLNAKLMSPEVFIPHASQFKTRGFCPVILYRQGEFNFWPTQHALSQLPFKIMNAPSAFFSARDKWATTLLWNAHNIPTPTTFLASSLFTEQPTTITAETLPTVAHALFEWAEQKLTTPFILKKRFSSQGNGVFLIQTQEELLTILRQDLIAYQCASPLEHAYFTSTEPPLLNRWLVQQTIKESLGHDVRVFVTPDSAHSIQRMNKNSFRSNLHQGGSASATPSSNEEKDLCERVHTLSKLNYSGIDFLRTKQGPLFLEINPSPGFEGIENIYPKTNIAQKILSLLQTI